MDIELIGKTISKKSYQNNLRKHSRITPDVKFKKFSLTKQKTTPRTDY